MEVGKFDNRYVVDQLQCLGILQTCEVNVLKLHVLSHLLIQQLQLCTAEYCSTQVNGVNIIVQ
jgi:hypothetical protein